MGKKLNPAYREKVARRLQLPRCYFCKRRSSKLVWYKEGRFHKACIAKWEAALAEQAAKQAAIREAQRQSHVAVRDWWNLTGGEETNAHSKM